MRGQHHYLKVDKIIKKSCFQTILSTCHNDVDLSDRSADLIVRYIDLSDNFVVIRTTLTGHEHVFKIYFLTNE